MSSNVSALLLGATGETGKELVKALCASDAVSKVILVGRRKLESEPAASSDKVEQRVVDFDSLEAASFAGADVAFCCLGTTRGKAGKDGFVKVDHDYVVNSAKMLKESGCNNYQLLSSKGASAGSLFLYPKVKVHDSQTCSIERG